MSKHKKYTPKHAAPTTFVLPEGPRRILRTTVIGAGVASVSVTGVAVSGGVLSGSTIASSGAVAGQANLAAVATGEDLVPVAEAAPVVTTVTRAPVVSRSADRQAADPAKTSLLSTAAGTTQAREENLDDSDPRDIAKALLPSYGFSADQFDCLDRIWSQESGWRVDADNPSSSAYGIPQALTATHQMPEGYMTSAEVQIRWGLDYIANRYGTPCSAWGFKSGRGWY